MPGFLVAFLLAATSCTAWAQSSDDVRKCYEATLPSKTIDFDLAVHYCTRAIQSGQLSDANLAAAFTIRGLVYYHKNEYDRAIEDYNTAIRLNPNNADAFTSRGLVYYRKNEYDRAIEDYSTGIRLNPNHAGAFINRGIAYNRKNEYDRAIEDYNTAIRLNPNRANAFYNRGIAYGKKGDYDRAIENYNTAIQLNPNYANAFTNRGRARFYLGRFSEAQPDLARAVETNPDNSFAAIWLYLARAWAGLDGKVELNMNARRLKLESWPGPVVKLYLGTVTASVVLSAAKDDDPKKDREQHCEAYFYLGQQALLHGDRAEAVRLFRATIATGVTHFIEYTSAQAELKRMGAL